MTTDRRAAWRPGKRHARYDAAEEAAAATVRELVRPMPDRQNTGRSFVATWTMSNHGASEGRE
jgi:hypothetical protein